VPLGASIPLYGVSVYFEIFLCSVIFFMYLRLFIFGLITNCSRTMPRTYKRKEGVRPRVCSWTTEQLKSAFDEIDKKTMGLNEISQSQQFGIPSRTLRRCYAAKNQLS
jgi:hypothetical protein